MFIALTFCHIDREGSLAWETYHAFIQDCLAFIQDSHTFIMFSWCAKSHFSDVFVQSCEQKCLETFFITKERCKDLFNLTEIKAFSGWLTIDWLNLFKRNNKGKNRKWISCCEYAQKNNNFFLVFPFVGFELFVNGYKQMAYYKLTSFGRNHIFEWDIS